MSPDAAAMSRLVRMAAEAPNCLACAVSARPPGPARHLPWHDLLPQTPPEGTPRVWRVVGREPGDPIEIGTTLWLEAADREYRDQPCIDEMEWLFTVLDGSLSGCRYHVRTAAWWGGPGEPWRNPDVALYPSFLLPLTSPNASMWNADATHRPRP